MSEIIQKLIGAFVEAPKPAHPLASIVEDELKAGRFEDNVSAFLASLPEKPAIKSVHVVRLTETYAVCQCRSKLKDHENPRFFDAEVSFEVELATGACRLMP